MKNYSIQLEDEVVGRSIIKAGGACYVAQNGLPTKEALFDSSGATLANPVTITNGHIDFWVADATLLVDLYVQGPDGHFVVVKDIAPSGPTSIFIPTQDKLGVMVIPFDIADTAAAVETDTGFDLPLDAQVIGDGAGVLVSTADATETIDVGILSGEAGGDANGFFALLDVAIAGMIAAAGAIYGTLLLTTFATTPTVNVAGRHTGDGTAESISYTLTASTDTAAGFIVLPYQLAP